MEPSSVKWNLRSSGCGESAELGWAGGMARNV